jgi:hypothetical protein
LIEHDLFGKADTHFSGSCFSRMPGWVWMILIARQAFWSGDRLLLLIGGTPNTNCGEGARTA